MQKLQMKKLVGAVLFTCVCAGLVLAQTPKAPSEDGSVADTLKQLVQEFGNAIKDVDTDKINQIVADDWASLGSSGRTLTRDGFLSDLKSGNHRLESFQIGPMDVRCWTILPWSRPLSPKREPTEGKTPAATGALWMFS
jgi:hypothetical protein